MRRRKVILGAVLASLLAGAAAAVVSTTGTASAATVYSVTPYVDLSAGSADMLDKAIASGGVNSYTAAFVIAVGCTPIWGDTLGIETSTVNARIARAEAAGAKTIISFGGAGGSELATSCSNQASLTAAYQSVITKYTVNHIDFDIEGAAIADVAANDRRFKAIKSLQASNPGLNVSVTIAVLESGPVADGDNFLKLAVTNGVKIDIVNAMVMDYGHAVSDMAAAAKTAAAGTLASAKAAGMNATYANIGITPMIGNNDSAGEVVSQANAQDIVNWSKQNGIGRLAFWSIGRDQPCAGGGVSPNCSGLGGSQLDFSKIFTGGGTVTPPTANPPTANPPTGNPPTGNPPTGNPPTGNPPVGCNGVATWNATAQYYKDNVVAYNGRKYTAKWWSQGSQPDQNTGDGKPWADSGACTGNPPTGNPPTSRPPTGNPPTGNPPTQGAGTTWVANHAYKIGDTVTYNGRSYRCLQSHTSLVGWEPPNVGALWQAI
jgi:chitodextrinase